VEGYESLSRGALSAIEAARRVLPLLEAGPPIKHVTPHGLALDVPVIYDAVAVDRMHMDPATLNPLPKGMPHPPWPGPAGAPTDEEVIEAANRILGRLTVVPYVEYREPERAWLIPLAWGSFIVLHLRLRVEGDRVEVEPDRPLMAELRGRAGLP